MESLTQEQRNHTGIKQLAADEKPREKLITKGAPSLSNAELLAILISTGTVQRSAIDLARDVLQLAENNLQQLGRLSIKELQKMKGIGIAKAITIAAALELGRRRQISEGLQRTSVTASRDAATIITPLINDLNHEVFCVLYLNQSNCIIKHEIVSSGGITGTVADVRLILKQALELHSSQLILAHNHPSGNRNPSRADKLLTQKIKDAAALMDIKLLDHLIIAGGQYYSMMDEGMM